MDGFDDLHFALDPSTGFLSGNGSFSEGIWRPSGPNQPRNM